jgi:ssRNA-specific RNase YbeY (16S rRNA maturation enzyme)
MPVSFHTADIKFSLRNRIALRGFIAGQVAKASGYKKINLSFVFCSDEYLLNINRQFLNHDYYTDIITFPLSHSKEVLEAEIYISVERVRENSSRFAVRGSKKKIQSPKSKAQMEQDFQQELLRVIFHGVLHLLGYKDKTKSDKIMMTSKENLYLGLGV